MSSDVRAKAPLVSVVVISYNHARYLACNLQSVIDQTYSNIELIVVDNASTDSSRDVIETFRRNLKPADDRQVNVFYSPDNLQLTGGMIAGFHRARGSYIAFLDGDDYFLPCCIEAHVRAFLMSRWPVGATAVDMYQSRGADLVTGARKTFSEYVLSGRGQQSSFCRIDDLDAFELTRAPGKCDLQEKDLHLVERKSGTIWPWSPTSALCFRREVVDLMFSYTPKLRAGTDAYLIRGISALTGSVTIDKPLSVYRQHGGNMFATHPSLMNFDSHDKEELAVYEIDIAREIIECYRTQAHILAKRLAWPDIYIDAVDMIAQIGPGLKSDSPFGSHTLQFIVRNRDLLTDAFGEATWRKWRRKYTRLPDLIARAKEAWRK